MTQSLSVTAASEPEPADESMSHQYTQYSTKLALGTGLRSWPAATTAMTVTGAGPHRSTVRTASFQQLANGIRARVRSGRTSRASSLPLGIAHTR